MKKSNHEYTTGVDGLLCDKSPQRPYSRVESSDWKELSKVSDALAQKFIPSMAPQSAISFDDTDCCEPLAGSLVDLELVTVASRLYELHLVLSNPCSRLVAERSGNDLCQDLLELIETFLEPHFALTSRLMELSSAERKCAARIKAMVDKASEIVAQHIDSYTEKICADYNKFRDVVDSKAEQSEFKKFAELVNSGEVKGKSSEL